MFVDLNNQANHFEAVLRWQPKGSKDAILLPIGEEILDKFRHNVKPGPMDDRNASLFFQVDANNSRTGTADLVVQEAKEERKGAVYRQPPSRS